MPLDTREAFGLFQQEVMRLGNQAQMLSLGLAGYQKALEENDALRKENEQLKQQLGQGSAGPSSAGSPSPGSTVPFPAPTPPQGDAPPPQG